MSKICNRYKTDIIRCVPDMSQLCPRYVTVMTEICPRYISSLEKGGTTGASLKARVTLVSAQRCNRTAKPISSGEVENAMLVPTEPSDNKLKTNIETTHEQPQKTISHQNNSPNDYFKYS